LPNSADVTLNEVKGLLMLEKNEILPPAFGGGQNDAIGLSNNPIRYIRTRSRGFRALNRYFKKLVLT
jgi:hypothetical protein